MSGTITAISGDRLRIRGLSRPRLGDAVRLSGGRIAGVITSIREDEATVCLWDEPWGLRLGDEAQSLGEPPMAELGPGLLGQLFDARQRRSPQSRPKGKEAEGPETALDCHREWEFLPLVSAGQIVRGGDVLGTVQETATVCHKILVPQGLSGVVTSVGRGKHELQEPVAELKDEKGNLHRISMLQRWPIGQARPYKVRRFAVPAVGGTTALVGPRGSGKSRLLRRMAQTAAADVIVCIGCGERGSEIRQWLEELRMQPESAGGCRLDRCVFVACPAGRPLDGRRAAVNTGLSIAEYFRDMGLEVLVLLDSLDRWAEAVPAVELESRLAQMLARTGTVDCLGGGSRRGSVRLCAAADSGAAALLSALCREGVQLRELPMPEAAEKERATAELGREEEL